MQQNKQYMLQYIHNVPYLIPFGQNIVTFHRSMSLNETGVFIWNQLEEPKSRDELFAIFAIYCEIKENELHQVRFDFDAFINQLLTLGVIEEDEKNKLPPETFVRDVIIGNLRLRFCGAAEDFSQQFNPFNDLTDAAEHITKVPDMTVSIHRFNPLRYETGEILIRNSELEVIRMQSENFLLYFPTMKSVYEAQLSVDGTDAHIYCKEDFSEEKTEQLFHVIRFLYLYLAARNGIYAIHSASLYYKGRAWLFSGHSGIGKSTHTNFWNNLLQTPIINGDLNLIAIENEKPIVYGLPWCGTSGISDPKTYPLGGIILLQQAPVNIIDDLTLDTRTLRIMQRFISPTWTKTQAEEALHFSKAISEMILVKQLRCTKSDAAVTCCKEAIDLHCNLL